MGSHLFLLSMLEWLTPLLAILVLPVVFLTGEAFYATSVLRRANRLLPGRSVTGRSVTGRSVTGRSVTGRSVTSPPLRWLWSPGPAAILHGRLKAACQIAGPVAGSTPQRGRWGLAWRMRLRRRRRAPRGDGIAELANDILEEAVLLERELVSTSFLTSGLPRARALTGLEQQVRALENSAHRVHQLALRRASLIRTGGPSGLTLDQRIATMEAAFGELELGSDQPST